MNNPTKRKMNEKCMECAMLDMRNLPEKPACYNIRICARRRSYYRDHDHKKAMMRIRFFTYKNMANECSICKTKHQLEVHHIEPRRGRDDRDALDNMITLCHSCHQIIESYTQKVRVYYTLQESIALNKNVTVAKVK